MVGPGHLSQGIRRRWGRAVTPGDRDGRSGSHAPGRVVRRARREPIDAAKSACPMTAPYRLSYASLRPGRRRRRPRRGNLALEAVAAAQGGPGSAAGRRLRLRGRSAALPAPRPEHRGARRPEHAAASGTGGVSGPRWRARATRRDMMARPEVLWGRPRRRTRPRSQRRRACRRAWAVASRGLVCKKELYNFEV